MDLINRQALLEWFKNWSDYDEFSVRYITGIIEDEPPIDAVKVVRCKDCKYFDSGTDEDGKLFFKCLGWVYGGTSEDDFCSYAERREEHD